VADKRCKNGHFIDESWDICPYCPPEDSAVTSEKIAVVQPKPRKEAAPSEARRHEPPPTPVVRREPAPAAPPPPPPVERTVAVPKVADTSAPVDQGARYVVGWLVALNGVVRGEPYAVRLGRNIIGRDRKSDIYVNDDQASAHHADLVFRPDEGRYILMDHNSTNGTYVNDVEIEPRRDLIDRDVVTIGRHRFLFVALCDERFKWDDRDSNE
jgi:hypothetical protein